MTAHAERAEEETIRRGKSVLMQPVVVDTRLL